MLKMKQQNKGLIFFLIILISLSLIFNYLIVKGGPDIHQNTILIVGMMWIPGISALLASLISKRRLRSVNFRFGKLKYLSLAYFIPLIYISLAYIPFWIFGYFNTEKALSVSDILLPFVGAFINIIVVFGEELGWRGFLFPELRKRISFAKAALLTGFIWSIWHLPGLILTDYGNNAPWFTAIPFFIITLTAVSYPMAWLCEKSKSIWPAVLFHSSHNAFIQAFFDSYSIKNNLSVFILGETGFALVITSLITLFIFVKIKLEERHVKDNTY